MSANRIDTNNDLCNSKFIFNIIKLLLFFYMIIWLASYPRSGNTLLRTICKQCFSIDSYADESTKEIGLQTNPELFGHKEYNGIWLDFYKQVSQSEETFLVKTHLPPIDNQPFIYIVRDGRSAICSYQKYHLDFNQIDKSMEGLIIGDDFYGDWSEHYTKWINRPVKKIIFRFEDLVHISPKNLKILAEYINYNGRIEEWVNPLEKLKSLEPKFFNQQRTIFIPDENWSNGTEYIFNRIHRPLMAKLGYYDDNLNAEPDLKDPDEAKDVVDNIIDLGRQIISEKIKLSKACNEKNTVITNLLNACEERLELINRLTKEADKRGQIIQELENKLKQI